MGIHMKNNINYTGATSLNTLRDVTIDSPATGQGIVWDEEKQQWTNGEVSTNDMVEITLAEYEALSTEEKNNDTTYFITDADNTNPGSVGTAGTLKPWLYSSDEEVVIGVYDGKPLYRKTYYIAEPEMSPTTQTLITIAEMENVEKIISTKGQIGRYISEGNDILYYPINTHERADGYFFFVRPRKGMDTNTIYIEYLAYFNANSVKDLTITIEYTKTTDAENSGTNLMPYSFVQNGGSQVELYTNSVSSIAISSINDMIPLVSITVPAGYYILDAHFNWNNAGLRWYTQITGEDFYAQSSGYDSAGHVVGAMQTICKLTKETTLTYSMWGDKNTTLNGAEIKALKISDIHD